MRLRPHALRPPQQLDNVLGSDPGTNEEPARISDPIQLGLGQIRYGPASGLEFGCQKALFTLMPNHVSSNNRRLIPVISSNSNYFEGKEQEHRDQH